jgi:hypothetical protein
MSNNAIELERAQHTFLAIATYRQNLQIIAFNVGTYSILVSTIRIHLFCYFCGFIIQNVNYEDTLGIFDNHIRDLFSIV